MAEDSLQKIQLYFLEMIRPYKIFALPLIAVMLYSCNDLRFPIKDELLEDTKPYFEDFIHSQIEIVKSLDSIMTIEDQLIVAELREKYKIRIKEAANRRDQSLGVKQLKKAFSQKLFRMEHQVDCGDFYNLWFKEDTISFQKIEYLCNNYKDDLGTVFIAREIAYKKLCNIESEQRYVLKHNKPSNLLTDVPKNIRDRSSMTNYDCAILFSIYPKYDSVAK